MNNILKENQIVWGDGIGISMIIAGSVIGNKISHAILDKIFNSGQGGRITCILSGRLGFMGAAGDEEAGSADPPLPGRSEVEEELWL